MALSFDRLFTLYEDHIPRQDHRRQEKRRARKFFNRLFSSFFVCLYYNQCIAVFYLDIDQKSQFQQIFARAQKLAFTPVTKRRFEDGTLLRNFFKTPPAFSKHHFPAKNSVPCWDFFITLPNNKKRKRMFWRIRVLSSSFTF